MPAMLTEATHANAKGLDALPDEAVLRRLFDGQTAALLVVGENLAALARGARLMAQTIAAGGRLVYAGAGSSGLMAVADGLELQGTFGIAPDQVVLLMAGGIPQRAGMAGSSEDDTREAAQAAGGIGPADTVIAVSASGRTPYACEIARRAQAVGARLIAIANVPGAPIFAHADVSVCLATPPEVVAGSTRMGAATAQKVVLNMMSTLMGLRLGHVHDGQMVNLIADNKKLRARAAAMVARICAVSPARAAACLEDTQGAVKPAVLLAAGAPSRAAAEAALRATGGHLRPALRRVTATRNSEINQTETGSI